MYLMDPSGKTLAASNWDKHDSFVGRNFAFRPYFIEAMAGRLGRFFGLGTTSAKRGYFFAAAVRDREKKSSACWWSRSTSTTPKACGARLPNNCW
nr:hypothetical protein GCM10020185_28220 [Pseudomonas brassicacearum subsp. brassicacearum]